MSVPVRIQPVGIMDKDSDLQYVKGGDYPDARNIRFMTTDGGTGNTVEPIKGNTPKWQIPGVNPTEKIYSIYFNVLPFNDIFGSGSTVLISFDAFDSTQTQIAFTNLGTFTYPGTPTVLNYGIALQNYIDSCFPSASPVRNFSSVLPSDIPGFQGTFNLTLDVGFDEWYAVVLDTSFMTLKVRSEAIALSGQMTPILSKDILGNMFVWSCNETVGVGEVGVVTHDSDSDAYTYTKLIRSKALPFRTSKQPDGHVELNNDRYWVGWTDNNLPPKLLYYIGEFVEDGFLIFNGGLYEYDSLADESNLFLTGGGRLEITGIKENGGRVSCGNKRYTGRLLTESFVGSEYFEPTKPIEIFSAQIDDIPSIMGDNTGVLSNKSVSLTLTNIPPGRFKYFELVCISYEGEAQIANLIRRFNIEDGQTELSLSHTGLGEENTLVSAEELLAVFTFYDKVKNMRALDNRLILSNLSESPTPDLTDWAQTIHHSINQRTIPTVGFFDIAGNFNYNLGEYLDPMNVYNNTGYMLNDTYRFGLKVRWAKSGKWSLPFWIDDIRFDTSPYNITDYEDGVLKPPSEIRRNGSFIDENITDVDGNPKVFYVSFENIDFNTIIDGVLLRDLITEVLFVRAERIPDVLATGIVIPGVADTIVTNEVGPYMGYCDPVATAVYPDVSIKANSITQSEQGLARGEHGFFYSPDIWLQNRELLGANLRLRVYGTPARINNIREVSDTDSGQTNLTWSQFSDFSGHLNFSTVNSTTFDIEEYSVIPAGSQIAYPGYIAVNRFSTFVGTFKGTDCVYMKLDDDIVGSVTNSYIDRAFYYAQVYLDIDPLFKYPINKYLTQYVTTGCYIRTNTSTGDVFGGDIYNQKSYVKQGYPESRGSTGTFGGGRGFSAYSQNTVNAQMRNEAFDSTGASLPGYIFPSKVNNIFLETPSNPAFNNTYIAGLVNWLEDLNETQRNYNKGYNYRNGIFFDFGYNADSPVLNLRPVTVAWSGLKQQNSIRDDYRTFRPLDFKDLNLTYGEIVHMEILNGDLYTWQIRAFARQFFNTTGLINDANATEITVGSAEVMSRDNLILSEYGTSNKWSVIKGRGTTGRDTAYWFNWEYRKFMRFAGDGSTPVSDIRGMRSFFANNARFVNIDTPADLEGIHGVWNDRFSEVVITFKGRKKSGVLEYETNLVQVNAGQYYYTSELHHSGLNVVYVCIRSHQPINDYLVTQPGVGSDWGEYWTQIGISDNTIYNVFTLTFSETKGGFTAFYAFLPNIYLAYRKSFFSGITALPFMQNLHDEGGYIQFYDSVVEDGYIQPVLNWEPNISKIYEAQQFDCQNVPYYVEFLTEQHFSFLQNSDFESRENFYYSPIKNDSVSTGLNTSDTSRLFGKFLLVKFYFQSLNYNKLYNFITKVRINNRNYRK